MALINRSIPNLYQGVSQQAASMRLPTQCEEQINAYSSIVEGLKKRPPTKHLAKLSGDSHENSYVHVINRDSAERYIVIISSTDLEVYDFAGNKKTVNFPNGKAYLTNTTPRSDFSAVTVADYTFIVNKTITVTMDETVSEGTIKGSKSRFTDLPTKDSVQTETSPAVPATYDENGVELTPEVPAVYDGDAPPTVGDIWEITGTDTNQFDQYYVKWDGEVWRETLKPGIKTKFNSGTMPHQLKRNSDGTFTFEVAEWNERLVGDDDSNKTPTFVDRTISEVFFHRNRFGVCADENVIFSRAGDFFNFWSETITAVLDSDPIDVSVNHNKVALIRYAVPFNTSLMLFSDQVQFQLSARDLLTPKTVNINATTEFEMNPLCKPVGNGQDLYFAVNKGAYTALKEYYVQPLTYTNDASEITSHVPKYIPQGVFKIISSNAEDILFVLNTTNRNQIHVYKFYWGTENEKVQSSWSQWVFNEGDVILNGDTINNNLYLIIQRSDGIYLEVLNFQAGLLEDDLPVLVHLDRKVKVQGTYDASTNTTSWTLPYPYNDVQGILGGAFGTNAGTELNLIKDLQDATKVTTRGNFTTAPVYFGIPYTMRYKLSEIFFRDLNDKSPVTHYQLQLKNLDVLYANTGYVRIEVTPKMRDTNKYIFTGLAVGISTLGAISLKDGKMRVPVYSNTRELNIDIINDTYLPCALQSAEWEAVLSTLSRRI